MVKLEAPGVEADRDVVGERVGAGEIKIDQAGQPIAEEEHVVGKQIGMDHALWQVARPMPLEMIELGNDRLLEPRLQAIGTARGSTKQRPPALDRECILALGREIAAGEMQLRKRFPERGAMAG